MAAGLMPSHQASTLAKDAFRSLNVMVPRLPKCKLDGFPTLQRADKPWADHTTCLPSCLLANRLSSKIAALAIAMEVTVNAIYSRK